MLGGKRKKNDGSGRRSPGRGELLPAMLLPLISGTKGGASARGKKLKYERGKWEGANEIRVGFIFLSLIFKTSLKSNCANIFFLAQILKIK